MEILNNFQIQKLYFNNTASAYLKKTRFFFGLVTGFIWYHAVLGAPAVGLRCQTQLTPKRTHYQTLNTQ